MGTINSKWAATPVDFNDRLDEAIWSDALEVQMKIPGGFMLAKNDARYLYVALDLVEDTHNDPGTGDYFWFSFDRNKNGTITPNYDVNYGNYVGNPNKMGRQYYLGPGRWTGLLNEEAKSECRSTFESSPNSDTDHRIWKFKFSLADLKINFMPFWWWPAYTKFGIRVHSDTPNLTYNTPSGFYKNFKSLHTLYLSKKPRIATADLGPVMGSVGLIPSTKIDTVTGRATTASNYFIHAKNTAFGGLLNVIGNRVTMSQLASNGITQYKVFHRAGTSGGYSEFLTSWYNYKWDGSDYVLELSGPDSGNFYKIPNAGIDYSIDDLLFQFNSTKLNTGINQFKVLFYNNAGNVVPVSGDNQVLSMYIDNNIPEVSIHSVKHGSKEINACAIVTMKNNRDHLTFDFEAFDTEGNLLGYTLYARWGEGDSETIVSEKYDTAAMPASWQGSHHISGSWIPKVSCAHSFNVVATARTTNGYNYIGRNKAFRYVTILKP